MQPLMVQNPLQQNLQPIFSTLSWESATQRCWPVVVVGAGPAGALAARELALRGLRVLLVDKAAFPRPKVCGGCLSPAALAVLNQCGLGHLPQQLGALPTHSIQLSSQQATASLSFSGGVALSRTAFDAALIREAITKGVDFLPQTTATLGSCDTETRQVQLRQSPSLARGSVGGLASHQATVSARVILAADGLAGSLLSDLREFEPQIRPGSRVGVGTSIECAEGIHQAGAIAMLYAPGGYVGLVRVEDGRLNFAAAFDVGYLRSQGGPAAAVGNHLRLLIPEKFSRPDSWDGDAALSKACWRGTPALTRTRSRLAAYRVLVLGDAAGYVEPFTGEGMTWALLSAQAIVPTVLEGSLRWDPAVELRWQRCHHRLIRRRQRVCRLVSRLLRSPYAAGAAVQLLARLPGLARPAWQLINQPA